jgi:hypothetical protein
MTVRFLFVDPRPTSIQRNPKQESITVRSTIASGHRTFSLAGAVALALGLSAIPLAPLGAQTPAKAPATAKPWVAPRTPDGKPDFQGNWSNETQTPFERMGKGGPTLTDAQAAALEKRAQDVEEFRDRPTEPGEQATKDNGTYELAAVPGEPTFVERIAQAAGGAVGGYNGFWLDPGNKVIRIDGVPRSSIVIDPADGHVPQLTDTGKRRMGERAALAKKFGEFEHPLAVAAVRMALMVDTGASAVSVTIIVPPVVLARRSRSASAGNKKTEACASVPGAAFWSSGTTSGSPPPVPPAAPGERNQKDEAKPAGCSRPVVPCRLDWSPSASVHSGTVPGSAPSVKPCRPVNSARRLAIVQETRQCHPRTETPRRCN